MSDKNNLIRNIGLIGHSSSGKTSLAEAMLFSSQAINRLGKVDEGTTTMDFEPEEVERKASLSTSFHPYTWEDNRFNLIDTPGENDFLSDSKICLQAAEGAAIIIDSVNGVRVGTEKVWNFATDYNLPKIIFINMVDRERADFVKVMSEIEEMFGIKATPIYLPVGKEQDFSGVVNLITQKAYIYKKDGTGEFSEEEVPSDMAELVKEWREKIFENIVEANDELMEKYLNGEELGPEEIQKTLVQGVKSMQVVPIIPGSATLNIGVKQLLDLINQTMPLPTEHGKAKGTKPNSDEELEIEISPDSPFSALVFKTIADPFTGQISIIKIKTGRVSSDESFYNVNKKTKERIGQILRIEGKKQSPVDSAQAGDVIAVTKLKETKTGDTLADEKNPIIYKPAEPLPPTISFAVEATDNEEKTFSSLKKLTEEDPTLVVSREQSTGETILSGMGQAHVEYTKEKLKRKFQVEIELHTPRVPYRETIKTAKENVVYKHKKQSGGRGQFAVVFFDVFPQPRGAGYEFDLALSGTNVPRNFVPAVEKGINETLEKGVVTGYPIVDIRVRFFDGKSHEVDSSEMAFKIAASHCLTQAMREASPVLLEPIMKMEITVPEDCVGDVMGDLNGRRGRVQGTGTKGKYQIIKAEAPLAEVLKYSYDLTSLTGGRGDFTMTQDRYEEVPPHLAEKVVAESKQDKEEE